MIRILADSADRAAVEPWLRTGLVAGVTTNPTILVRAGLGRADIPRVHEWAAGDGREVCFQVWGAGVVEMLDSAAWLREVAPGCTVKVPATAAGCEVAATLQREGVPVLLTAGYDARQAVLASALGVRYLAAYVDRIRRLGRDHLAEVRRMVDVLPADVAGPQVMAASVKSAAGIMDLVGVGVRTFTLPVEVIAELVADADVDAAVAVFEADMTKVLGR